MIKNGLVCDGSGSPWTKLDIAIKGDRIVKLAHVIDEPATTMIDATDLVVAPGFIDTHTHSDLLCTKPEVHQIRVLQGITTELIGQDGISVAPVSPETKHHWQDQMRGINGDIGEWPWETVGEYLDFLSNSSLIGHMAYLVPHGNIRTMVLGFAGREATKEECQKMREIAEEAMKQGAFGLSTGIQYPPCSFATEEELTEICKGVAKYDGCFVVHMRNESNLSLEAIDEVIRIARNSGIRLHISHFKICGEINRHLLDQAIEKLEQARQEGIEVTYDQYPYTAASTILQATLPPWVQAGGTSTMIEKLKDKDIRKQLRHEMLNNGDYDNPVRNNGWHHIVIASVDSEKNKALEGMRLSEIAKLQDKAPADVVFDLLIEEHAAVTMIIHFGEEEDVIRLMQHPLQIVGSDGIFGGKPHPRLYGSYQRVLGYYSRERGAFPVWEAVRKMTGAPAQLLRLKDRGYLKEGYKADVVIFDYQTIIDRATFANPHSDSVGIKHVFVNGKQAVKDGQFTGETAGTVLYYTR